MKFFAWLLSLLFAFNLGAQNRTVPTETDEELRGRVQGHLDTIVDESAAIVDEIAGTVREDGRVQEAERFASDMKDIAEEAIQDLDQVYQKTRKRVEERLAGDEAQEPAEGEPVPMEPEVMPVPETDEAAENDEAPAEEAPAQDDTAPETPGEDAGEAPVSSEPELPVDGDPFNG